MYGAILASQSGRDIDIVNSFDLPLHVNDKDELVLDKTFLLYKLEQCMCLIYRSISKCC